MSRARTLAGCRARAKNGKLCEERSLREVGNLTTQKSGDVAVTSGDKLSGMELGSFSGQKRKSRAVFGRSRANLEAEAPRLPSDRKKRTFRAFGKLAVLSTFSTQNGAVTSTKTFSRMENLSVLQGFSTQNRKLGYYRPVFLSTR